MDSIYIDEVSAELKASCLNPGLGGRGGAGRERREKQEAEAQD